MLYIYKMTVYKGVSKKFPGWPPGVRTENGTALCHQCNYITILWVNLVSFATITLCIASQLVFIVVAAVYFVIDSVQKLLDTPLPTFIVHWTDSTDFDNVRTKKQALNCLYHVN